MTSNNQPKINYQLELDRLISQLQQEGRRPSLLLHSCCGPCSSYVVTYLKDYFEVTVFFYNPNIYPQEEYLLRLQNQKQLLEELQIPLLTVPYDHQEFLDCAKGFEQEPEGGARCGKCFALRLEKTRNLARERGFEYFCTTLTVSPHKNAMIINAVGNNLADSQEESSEHGAVLWLASDFKKRDGYKKSIELSHQYNLYRQDYCGCEMSMRP